MNRVSHLRLVGKTGAGQRPSQGNAGRTTSPEYSPILLRLLRSPVGTYDWGKGERVEVDLLVASLSFDEADGLP